MKPSTLPSQTLQICVCICTYKRPLLLRRLLDALPKQLRGSIDFEVTCTVVDNDASRSAETIVSGFCKDTGFPLRYECEPERNFAIVRNRAVDSSDGHFIAFVDDDEVPANNWLLNLMDALYSFGSDGALGPVRPYFEEEAPGWLKRSRSLRPSGVAHWHDPKLGAMPYWQRAAQPGDFRCREDPV